MEPNPSVLIIDDTRIHRKALRSLLEKEGYRLSFSRRVDEALRLARKYEPDLILIDMMLPGLGAYAVCRKIRSDVNLQDVPILLIDSLADRHDRLIGLGAGADDFISRPFDEIGLLARLRMITRLNRFRILREEHAQLEKALFDLRYAYDATIEGWVQALDLRDKESEGHTRRVTDMTVQLGRSIGIDEEAIGHYRRGALLHDIGKLGIPDSILHKQGPLSEEELKILRLHPEYSFQWLSRIEYLRPALDIPYCHHEKWDGSGYPSGLRGEEIPFAARLFAVVDVWDALLSARPYKEAWSIEKACEYLVSQKSIHFDPWLVDVFLEKFVYSVEDKSRKAIPSLKTRTIRPYFRC